MLYRRYIITKDKSI